MKKLDTADRNKFHAALDKILDSKKMKKDGALGAAWSGAKKAASTANSFANKHAV